MSTPQIPFRSPRFNYSALIEQINELPVGGTLYVRDVVSLAPNGSSLEQVSLCSFLRRKGVRLGVEAQTAVVDQKLYLRKLTEVAI